uniref:Uncharacterized protein n=1 Tax=Acrobeloides nanus TaxID=290746 RepID=A0A914ED65_9BILA
MSVDASKFYEKFNINEGKSSSIFSASKIELIKDFLINYNQTNEEAKLGDTQSNWLKRYYVEQMGDVLVLRRITDKLQVVSYEDVFEILQKAHNATNHGGRDLMIKEIEKRYSGIPRNALMSYLSLCQPCQLKKAKTRKGLVVKPILSKEMNSRCQVDLIDFQAQENDGYKFLMVYQDMVATWCDENKSTNWVQALPIIQAAKNRRFHSGIKRSPYEAMFGQPMNLGISNDPLPAEIIDGIETEEDLEKFFNIQNRQEENLEAQEQSENENEELIEFFPIDNDGQEPGPSNRNHIANEPQEFNFNDDEETIDWGERIEMVQKQREGAREAQKRQAEKMLNRSNKKLKTVPQNTSVLIPVPSVDRAKGDYRNIMGVVMSESNGLYQIGTTQGIIPQKFVRNQFEPATYNFLTPEHVPNKATNVRSSAIASSNSNGQGFFYCNCTTGCENNRCKCLASSRICNSKCHGSRTCKNK